MKAYKVLCLNLLILMLAAAGIIFLGCTTDKVAKNVVVDGVKVGGMSCKKAAEILRANTEKTLAEKTLEIVGGKEIYTFSYPEIGYADDLAKILRTAKKGGRYAANTRYFLKCGNEIIDGICSSESLPVREPSFKFKKEGETFVYDEGYDGLAIKKEELEKDISCALAGDGKVYLKAHTVPRTLTLDDVKKQTAHLCSYTTYFDGENINRSSNIRLAANLLNGLQIGAGEEFSFNAAVGKRTPERGFLTAKIIEDGEFVEGTGGGVCQVSTTLYNAALLAGCEIVEYHPHSLPVSYVPPSRDAMVSGDYCDLKFTRTRPFFIRATAGKNHVTFTIYGESDGCDYSLESTVTGYIDPPEEVGEVAREGKQGVTSECRIISNRGGARTVKLLRRDSYKPQKRITVADGMEISG